MGADENAQYTALFPQNVVFVPIDGQPYLDLVPGLTKYADGVGKDRGAIYCENDYFRGQFRVSGTKLIEVINGDIRELGDIPGTQQAILIYTLNNLSIITEGKNYLWNPDDGVRQVTENLGYAIDQALLNSKIYRISFDSATGITYIVQGLPNQDDKIEPLAYETADVFPDPANGIEWYASNMLVVINRFSLEFYSDQGGDKDFTLVRQASRVIEGGAISTLAKCRFAGSWALIGGRKDQAINVHLIGNGSLQPLGTHTVQRILEKYTEKDWDSIRLESRSERGHEYLLIHLPDAPTLMYNGATSQWIELKTGQNNNPWRGMNAVYDPNVPGWITGDKLGGNVGFIDYSTFAQYDEIQEFVMYSPIIKFRRQNIPRMRWELAPGRYPQGSCVELFLSASSNLMNYPQEHSLLVADGLDYYQQFEFYNMGWFETPTSFKVRGQTGYRLSFAPQWEQF